MLKNTLSVMLRKLKGKIRLKHPPSPPSKEGGISAVFPLGEGGPRGIVPKTFSSLIEIHNVKENMKTMSYFNGFGNL